MKTLLLPLVALLMTEAAGSMSMYRRLMTFVRETGHTKDRLNKFFANILPNFHCVQTYTDGTNFADSFLHNLHEVEEIPPLILGVEWSEVTACKGFVLLAENYNNARKLIKSIPRYGEHRILLLLRGPPIVLNEVLMGGPDIFMDADVVAVASGNFSSGYVMAQPKRNFVKYSKFKKWIYSDQGPRDFQGRSIQVLTYNCSLFSQMGPVSPEGTPAWMRGVEIELFQDIAERLNLKPQFRPTERPKSASTLWYQNALMDKRASGGDMAFCGILMSNKKINKDVIMSVPLTLLCLKLLVPRPSTVNTEWDGVFMPFQPELWFVIAMAVFVIAFLLQRLTITTRRFSPAISIRRYEGIGVSFIQILSVLVMTDIPRSTPDQRAVRHLLTWWAMFTLVLSTCYSSGLITHLTKQKISTVPDNFQELNKEDFHWSMANIPDFSELFDKTNPEDRNWMFRFRQVSSRDDHVRLLLRQKKQALWGYQAFGGFTLPDYDLPDFVMDHFQGTSSCFMEYFNGFAIREGCPFENPINGYIQAYNEAGLVRPLFQKVYYERHREYRYVLSVLRPTKERFSDPKGLRLQHLLGIIIVWSLGTALAIITFLLELAQKCWI